MPEEQQRVGAWGGVGSEVVERWKECVRMCGGVVVGGGGQEGQSARLEAMGEQRAAVWGLNVGHARLSFASPSTPPPLPRDPGLNDMDE